MTGSFKLTSGCPQDESSNTLLPFQYPDSRFPDRITGRYDSLKTVPQQLNRSEANRACSTVHNTALNDHLIVNVAIRPVFDTIKTLKLQSMMLFGIMFVSRQQNSVSTISKLMQECHLYPHSDPTIQMTSTGLCILTSEHSSDSFETASLVENQLRRH